jgi:hypothetical protein
MVSPQGEERGRAGSGDFLAGKIDRDFLKAN